MQIKSTFSILFFLCAFSSKPFAQNSATYSDKNGTKISEENNLNHIPCISSQEYTVLEKQCNENIKLLGLEKPLLYKIPPTLLNWPIRAASGFTDCDYYFIGAYVDQDTATGTIRDFECGNNTYDGHHGTDISVWPFGFYKMDNSQVEVIAAAPGTIVQKADGNFDRNCSANNLTANSIIIQHADGSEALYWHMKSNSLTAKSVGQTVVAGEYLGVVGSSGSASGPHLHFEVWTGITNTTYNDPFSGTCNSLNASSWWNVQKPHTNSAIIKVSTNTTDIVLPGCPTTETPNETDNFSIPFQGPGLSPGYAKFYFFIRDDVTGLTADCKIVNPNGSTFTSWTYTSTANNKTYIRGYSKLLPTIAGTYTFQTSYNGLTCSKTFVITQPAVISPIAALEQLKVFNNPANGTLTVTGAVKNSGNYSFSILNITGKCVHDENIKISNNFIDKTFFLSPLANGIYFLIIDSGEAKVNKKIIVQR